METQSQVVENVSTQTQVKYVGFWVRLGAYFIDGLVLIIPQLILSFIIGASFSGEIRDILSRIASALLVWGYFIFMTHKYQATFGKKAAGIKVISNKTEKLSLGQIILREIVGKFVSMVIFCIGFIMIRFTEKKQGLHDMIADTTVVYVDPNKKKPIWIVVVAAIFPILIIAGILSSVILASLNVAKIKAEKARIDTTLQQQANQQQETN